MGTDAECDEIVGMVPDAAFCVLREAVLGGGADEDGGVIRCGLDDVVEPLGEGSVGGGVEGEDAAVVGADGVGVVAVGVVESVFFHDDGFNADVKNHGCVVGCCCYCFLGSGKEFERERKEKKRNGYSEIGMGLGGC